MPYKIEKNTVQETLVIPVYARKMCSELYPDLYRDENAARILGQIDYDFSVLEKKSRSLMQRFGFLEAAMRQNDLAWEVRDYLRTHPRAAVVNLGCGLDDTGRRCDNGSCRIYNLDLPGVIAVRDALLPAGEREENIPCDLNDPAWFDRIDASGGAVFFAAGVFYYFLREQVQSLVQAMAAAFPGARLVFDAANEKAVRLMLKTWIKDAQIRDVGAYFAVADAARELSGWAPGLRVSSRGYMLGYHDQGPVGLRLFPLPRARGRQPDAHADRPAGIRRTIKRKTVRSARAAPFFRLFVQKIEDIVERVLQRLVARGPALVLRAHHVRGLARVEVRDSLPQLLRLRQQRFAGECLRVFFLRHGREGDQVCHRIFILSVLRSRPRPSECRPARRR